MSTVVSVNVGIARPYRRGERVWQSGIVKAPVAGSVSLVATGVVGDEQADLENHGGADKAVLAYGASRYRLWNENHGLPASPGGFGENLTIDGLTEETACIGDTLSVGTSLLQVTQPRLPCWKLAERWERPDLTRLVKETGWSGWYLRVLEPGSVAAGDTVSLLSRPHPDWTVLTATRIGRMRNHPGLLELAALPELSEAWRQTLRARAL